MRRTWENDFPVSFRISKNRYYYLSVANIYVNFMRSSQAREWIIIIITFFYNDTFAILPLSLPSAFSFPNLSIYSCELPRARILPRILTPFFTLLHLGIDVNGPQSQLLVLVNHPPWGLPVEFSIWFNADVPPPGSQHSGTADATHPRPRHHPFSALLVSYFLRARYMVYYKERITMNGRLFATISAASREKQHATTSFLSFSPSSRETFARYARPFHVTSWTFVWSLALERRKFRAQEFRPTFATMTWPLDVLSIV